MMHPIHAAKEAGLSQYETGKPCRNGHIAPRYVSSRCCIICSNEKKQAWVKKNPEVVAQYDKKYTDAHRARRNEINRDGRRRNPERTKESKAKEYHKNKVRRLATMKRWREANLDLVRESHKRKRAEYPERYSCYARNYRNRKRNAEGSHNGNDILAILKAQKGRCTYCRVKVGKKYHVDHVIPLFRGGSNGRENLQILCARCNQTKHAKDPIVFAQSLGLLL